MIVFLQDHAVNAQGDSSNVLSTTDYDLGWSKLLEQAVSLNEVDEACDQMWNNVKKRCIGMNRGEERVFAYFDSALVVYFVSAKVGVDFALFALIGRTLVETPHHVFLRASFEKVR